MGCMKFSVSKKYQLSKKYEISLEISQLFLNVICLLLIDQNIIFEVSGVRKDMIFLYRYMILTYFFHKLKIYASNSAFLLNEYVQN